MYERDRELIVQFGLRILRSNHVSGTSGNISLRVSQDMIAITPSGVPYDELSAKDIPIIDLEGHLVEGNLKPSVEHQLHCLIYKTFQDIHAVIHTHSIYSTVLSILHKPLPAINETLLMIGESIPVSEYANAGSSQLADYVVSCMKKSKAVIMANHGLVCAAKTLQEAFDMCETVERGAQVYVTALSTGLPIHLIDEKCAKEAIEFLSNNYGQRR
ncbi:MAG TPA: class II aldolase/adducin family protein [Pseudothermotoga sp.]|nr:class II aldolase/adducin family protein [Pseudothermotoga sp.]HOK83731.1 class II aldolase/adducin family protein [Pseudothermotoga sp.]HPP69370.1 class II aldolase/adducin family protein [Pseudothermotoga sp.]